MIESKPGSRLCVAFDNDGSVDISTKVLCSYTYNAVRLGRNKRPCMPDMVSNEAFS